MFDGNGNALLSGNEWVAVASLAVAVTLVCIVAVIATMFPRH